MKVSTNKPLLKSLSGEVLTRPPFWLMRQAGRYLPEYRATRADAGNFLDLCYNPALAEEVTLQPLRRYGMDAAILFADILLIPHALGQPLAYREGEGPVLDPIRSAKELGKLDVTAIHKTLDPVYETVGRLSQSIPKDCTLIGFAGAPWTVATYMVEGRGSKDYAHIKNWAYSDPQGFGAMMDILVESTTEYLLKQVAAGAEVIQIFDTWAGVLPDDEFRKWAIEPTKRIVEGLRTQYPELPVIGFPKGVGGNIIDFVRETGVTAVSLDTGTPLDWAAREVQSLVPVQGNLDPMLLVSGGSAMEDRINQILETLGKKPFIFNLGHGIVPQTPPENVARLAELIRGA
ncbi:uroporphyrinogen decarboxylase [Sneathiella sp.]|uniref:uroporphyrinogen decarboxylase n=1 Tax=Sneathiella sp. TaxID=1964365 RepID=UPI0026331E40|nr:uroporphyrinogen decarboxylase [Sneathiella sp.]MDF2368756.1 uroporphyrinogen decarboxylase [Sneathiella sp.]